jgi:hypothetical protein
MIMAVLTFGAFTVTQSSTPSKSSAFPNFPRRTRSGPDSLPPGTFVPDGSSKPHAATGFGADGFGVGAGGGGGGGGGAGAQAHSGGAAIAEA